ncbi:sigma-70 family RNA polymerase sigma factor [Isoptericola halotolerans]|uniref:sigma-70 family RNA polymerase sigma factor n=1 Tax=Isoptericola halotolerans TaxID=300560 RepID=UPI00388F676A
MPRPSETATEGGTAGLDDERRRLTLLAYRMCGSWADAEDVVQQVYLEWWRAHESVDNGPGWLTRTTVRRAIDALRARQRDAAYVGPWLPEPVVQEPSDGPHSAAEQSEAMSTAFLLLAESLTPPQRAVVVLRALRYEHAEVADILGISPAAARQHHVRGLRRLAERDGRAPAVAAIMGPRSEGAQPSDARDETARLLTAFLTAARRGDTAALTALLHEDVRAYNDGGGRTRAARRVVTGGQHVARFVIGVAGRHEGRRAVRLVTVNGTPGALVTLADVGHVLSLEVRDGRIYRLFDVCDTDKLSALRTSALRGCA